MPRLINQRKTLLSPDYAKCLIQESIEANNIDISSERHTLTIYFFYQFVQLTDSGRASVKMFYTSETTNTITES